MKIYIVRHVTPCIPSKANKRFWGTCHLHLQGPRIRQARNKQSSACYMLSRWFLARLILRPWRWRRYVPPKRRSTFNGIHSVISKNIELFATTVVRISNPTKFCLNSLFPRPALCPAHRSFRDFTVITILVELYKSRSFIVVLSHHLRVPANVELLRRKKWMALPSNRAMEIRTEGGTNNSVTKYSYIANKII
jgi:hypothetical protein